MVLGPFEERGSKRRFGNSGEECRHEVCIFPPVKFVPPVVLRKKSFCYVKPLYVQGNGRLEPLRGLGRGKADSNIMLLMFPSLAQMQLPNCAVVKAFSSSRT
ncbi:OLC1v1028533C1 [Oldenlandia corymbosa var. corymbosa]|uniref:OLC1v1028533C1 n=1 Tax=Oldenlandia corymbosa var. corymbosa TaxID=529605 RepID=A0AAV1CDP9_OLDCO|nr:OLC1v1028533C1 [Oldenlandia corymbosa var. corymbosa]